MTRAWTILIIAALMAGIPQPAHAKARTVVSMTEVSYGADPLQVATVSRPDTPTGKAVLFLHGGGWASGGRGSLQDEAAEWAKTGWIAVNGSYRLGVLDGTPDDGKAILADATTLLNFTRTLPGVDPAKVIVYGESAGGHLATWLGSYYGSKVAGIVAISPVSSISGAIAAGQAPGAPAKVVALGDKAQEFFGHYSTGTTDAHRYLDRVQAAWIVVGTGEWVDPDVHGIATCTALGARCTLTQVPEALHAGAIMDAHPDLRVAARHWADQQL
jgi:acetyl esterase/lipase